MAKKKFLAQSFFVVLVGLFCLVPISHEHRPSHDRHDKAYSYHHSKTSHHKQTLGKHRRFKSPSHKGSHAGLQPSITPSAGAHMSHGVHKVVLLGDSLTALSFTKEGGWATALAEKLRGRQCEIAQRGYGGFTTRHIRVYLPVVASTITGPITAITVLLGSNDVLSGTVSLPEYMANLKWIVQYLQVHGIPKQLIILISPPIAGVSNNKELLVHYAKGCGEVAAEMGCEFLDLYQATKNAYKGDWKRMLLTDGVHFSQNGSRILADALWPLIDKRTRHLLPKPAANAMPIQPPDLDR